MKHRNTTLFLSTLIIFSFLSFACMDQDPVRPANAITIIGLQKDGLFAGNVQLQIEVKNSARTRYQPSAQIKLKKGNKIVGSSYIVYTPLDQNEREEKRAVFIGVKSHSDYDLIHVEVNWDDGEWGYFTERVFR